MIRSSEDGSKVEFSQGAKIQILSLVVTVSLAIGVPLIGGAVAVWTKLAVFESKQDWANEKIGSAKEELVAVTRKVERVEMRLSALETVGNRIDERGKQRDSEAEKK